MGSLPPRIEELQDLSKVTDSSSLRGKEAGASGEIYPLTHSTAVLNQHMESAWDKFVEAHHHGWICHLSGWKRALEKSFKHMGGHLLVLLDGNNPEEIRAGLPLYSVKSWLLGNRLVAVPRATLSDPLISETGDLEHLMNGALRLASDEAISRIEIRTFLCRGLDQDPRFSQSTDYQCHFIPLDAKLDQVRKRFHRSCVRQRIDRALSSGLKLRMAQSDDDLAAYFRLHKRNQIQKGLPVQPYGFFSALWNEFGSSGRVRIRLCEHEGSIIGGLLLFCFRARASAEGLAWDEARAALSPGHFLVWNAMQEAHREGFEVFDFGRTSRLNRTLLDFKSRWGTTVTDLRNYHYPRRAVAQNTHRETKIGYRSVRLMLRIGPMGCQEWLGRLIHRHLS